MINTLRIDGECRPSLAAMKSFNIDRAITAIQSDYFETLFNRENNLAFFMKARYSIALSSAKTLLSELDAHIAELEK